MICFVAKPLVHFSCSLCFSGGPVEICEVSVTLTTGGGGDDTTSDDNDDVNDDTPACPHTTVQVLCRGGDFLPGYHAVWCS